MPTVAKTASLLALFLCVGPWLSPPLGRAAVVPQTSVQEDGMETLRVSGLREPVEILTDRWGIAHIYAKNQPDLFFAQGYNAARDRLFQLEIWRRRVTGTLAEIQGPKALERDIGARLLRFRGDLDQECQHYHPDGKEIIAAFVQGINAYIRQTREQPELLPLEFNLLGITPQAWTPDIVLARLGGIFLNLETEVLIAQALQTMQPETIRTMLHLHPGTPDLTVPEGLDVATIPVDVLKYYQATREAVAFAPEDIIDPQQRAPETADATTQAAGQTAPPAFGGKSVSQDEGSNNWVVDGTKTLSRKPLMVNDPHRSITAPSLRYWVHLVAPGWNVIGGGEPHLPGVSIGHNEQGAWGLTIFPTDSEDLYVYKTNPANPQQYWYRGEWEDMRVLNETLPVKGQDAVTVALKYTRHGPILAEDPQRHLAFGLRAAWLDIGGAPYLASLRMDQATTWQEFRAACAYSRAPSENMVWADTRGNIGWQAVGVVPLRPNWNGLTPVPGDGRFEWDGYLPIRELPHSLNPPQGFIATANQENLPPNYPYPISYYWLEPYRFARIEEVLAAGKNLTAREMMHLQSDEYSIPARLLVPFLHALDKEAMAADPLVQAAVTMLRAWDFVLDKDSVAAGIYAAWQRQLWEQFRDTHVPAALRESFASIVVTPLINSLLAPDGGYGPDPLAGRDRFIRESFEAAVRSLATRFGPDMDNWTYGQTAYHHIVIKHMLSDAVNAELRAQLDVGPIPRGGDSFTVNNTGSEDMQTVGASFRLIADPGNWDRSLGINTPGQAGDPAQAQYRALSGLWAEGKYFPVLYSRDKILAVTEHKTLLQPEP